MKILCTGGTGFLGRRTVARLAPHHELTLLVRPTSVRTGFPDDVAFAEGDVTDRDSLVRAVAGHDAVLHAAALVKILAPAEQFDRINVAGLENVLAAAEAAGVPKTVYVSSFMALGPTEHAPGRQLDETALPDDRDFINDYERTKTLADRRARQAIDAGAPVDIVYPGVVYGPGEMTEGNIVVRHILDLARGKLPALLGSPERLWNYVFVEDVAAGIVAALERPSHGERFMLGGENVTQRRFYELIETLAGVRVPNRRMPNGLAKLAGAAMKGVARLTRSTPQLTPDLVDIYTHDWAYSSRRAERELSYRPRSLEDGLRETIAWLHTQPDWPTRPAR